jgi:hypothetical protein
MLVFWVVKLCGLVHSFEILVPTYKSKWRDPAHQPQHLQHENFKSQNIHLLLRSVFSHQMKKTVDHLLSKELAEDDIDKEIENFRQERLTKAEEEAKDVSA